MTLRHALLLGVAGGATLLAVAVGNVLHPRPPQVEFLQAALGEPTKTQSFERRPGAGTVVRLAPGGYSVQSAGLTVGLRAADAGRGELQGFEHGAARRTEYGWEAVTVSEDRTEQFLTVGKRQGVKRWRWQLQTLDLIPRVGGDGSVGFIDDGRLLDRLVIEAVRVLDGERRDVTPKGLRWSLEEGEDGTWSLALDLDDRDLPLPYVIDPAIAARTPASSANTGGGANTITITKPAGLVAGDLMLAQITTRGGTNIAICPPTVTGTWTSVNRTNSTTTLGQEVFRLSATAADVAAASYAFQLRTTTCAGGLSTQKASGGIVAYVDTANQPNPIDASAGQAFASASTVTPPAVTPTVANTRVASFYGAANGGTVGNNWTGVTAELWDQSSTGGTAASRTTSAAGDAAGSGVGVPFTPSTGDWTSANAVNIGQTLALAPLAADGSGTLTTPTTNVAAGSTGNTLTFTYTAATGGMRNGSVTLVVPTGWSAPSTTGTAAGYTTSSTGTVGVVGQTITVSGVTLTATSTLTVVYGSTAGTGPGATATATTGAQTWQAQQRSSSVSGALANLGASPSVTVNAADGSGTLTTPTTNVPASSTGDTLTFTYTAATGGMANGDVRLTVPTGWSAPSTTGTAAGYTTASTGTVGVAGQVITVTGVTLAGAGTLTLIYGSTAGGGPGATATATTGAQTWQGAQRSVAASTITNLGASPSVTVNAADGSGTLTTPTTNVAASSAGNTLTFTYTAATGGMVNGAVRVTVPTGWSAPSTTGTAAGYTTASTGTVGVAAQVVTVTGVTLAGAATMTITYGSTAGGGPGATAAATTGAQTWQGAQRSLAGSTITNLGASPSVTVNAADGTGTLTTPTANVAASSAANTLTFTYTAATGGMSDGAVRVTVPTGWSAPSTIGTAAGYTTASTGTVGVAAQVITVTGVTLAGGATMTITYGSTAGGGPAATATATTGAQTWQGAQRSVTGSAITSLGASPSVTVNAADGTGTLTTPTTNVAASSAGNTLTFTYTAATGGMANGAVRLTVPAGWSAPSTTGTAAGYTTASTGTVGVAGQVVTVTGITLAGGATLTLTYGSTAGGGPGATATATTGAQTWQGEQRSVATGTITNLGASPSVTVNTADGSGTLTTPTTNVAASSAANTLVFTYTAATGGMSNGAVRVTVPTGWSAPSTTGTAAGYTTASTGTVGVAGQVVTVTGVTLAGGATMTITYGSTAGAGPGATATATTGAQTWQGAQRSLAASTITNLGASPSVTVNAADGSGTLTTPATNVAASSAANTLVFTYTAATGGMSNGAVRVTVPTGWSAPSTTGTAAGYTTASTGTVGVAAQVVTVTGVTLAGGATMTITYGSTAGGGPGATATATTGAQTWQGAQRSLAGSTITNLGASPSVTVNAADGSGTLTTPTSNVAASSSGNTLVFTYTAATGGMSDGAVRVTVPTGWSAPSTTGTAAGYTTASTGTVGVAGQVVTVTGVTLAGAATLTLTYGSTAGGGPGATATATTGAQTWQGAQRSVTGSAITSLGASPSVTVNAADGTGTLTTPTTNVANGSGGNTLVFTYTAATGGMSNGAVRVTVPTGWSAPSLTGTAAGYTTAGTGTVGVAGQIVTVTGVTLAGGATMTVTYGSTAGGGPGATAPTTPGAQAWQGAQRSVAASTITNLGASPSVTVLAADGTGTLGAAPTSFVAGSTGNTVTLTYTAAAGGMSSGAVRVTLPAGWSAPSTTSTAAGYTTASTGTVGVAGQVITVTGVTLAGGGTLTILYGSGAGGGPGATAPTGVGVATWQGEQRSSAGGAFTNLGSSPSITITPGPLNNFLVEAAGGGAIGTQTVAVPFSVRVTARDVHGNTVTAFNGAGNTVDMSSSGTLTAGSGTTATFTNGVLASHSLTLGSSGSTTVTATRTSGGSQSGTSASFTTNPGTLTNTAPVSITGTAKVGEVLTRSAASWTPAPDSRAYQWRRCNAGGGACADIGGATGTTYTLVAADLGQTIRVVETASKASYNDASDTSAQTSVVVAGDFTNTSPVSITGTVKVGEVLTRAVAGWTPAPDSRAYQWRSCNSGGGSCADIGGETGTSYTLVAADLGQTIRVVETASKTAYNNATSTSAQTAVVANGDLTNTSPVSITGTVKVGEVLTRTMAGWTPTPDSRAYQWRRCNSGGGSCADLSGETGTSYTLVAADLGQTIRVVETASKTAYNNANSTSSQTAVVAAGDLVNTTPVSITGTVKVGEVLTRAAASWTPAPDSRAYQWRRCNAGGGACADISGETGTTYTLVAADLGQTIRVVETASKTAYNNATSTSTQTAVVANGDLTNTSPVSITGTVKVGDVLTRGAATWTPAADSQTYQWRRCDSGGGSCADIGGANGTTYTLAAADLGQTIRVVETASKTAYNNATATSTQTTVVANGDLTNTSPVSITGTAKVGEVLTRSAAGWNPGPDSRAYQWRRCNAAGGSCADIAGETGTTYTLLAADLGQTIRVVETASKTAYNNATSTSSQTVVVVAGDLTNTSPVSITGTVKVGEVLTRAAGGWTPAPDSRAYQWRRCDSGGGSCADIGGETGTTYTLVAADLGQTIRVVETASKTAYNNATSTSSQTTVAAAGDLTNTSPVSITGTVKVGEVLTRSAGGWTPAPDSRTYQWRRCDSGGGSCANISGETGTTYTLVAADLGQTIRVVETASKTAYNNATSTSSQTAVVVAGDFTNTSPVAITGTVKVGEVLTRAVGGWTPAPDSRAFQWRRCNSGGGSCADISGETGTSYTLVAADLGQTIRVVETASKTAYNNATSTSSQTAVVAPGDLTNTSPVSITGTVKVGEVLTRAVGGWTPAPDSHAYQWRRCDNTGANCADLGGETGTSYTLVAADLGQTIRVVETASKTAYNNATSTSAQTVVVAPGDLTNTSPVSITGTLKVGEVLTRGAATWTPAADSQTYQWRRCDSGGGSCADIGGANGTTYTLAAADLGQTIRVVETASKTAYNNATSTSTQTTVVANGDLTNTSPVSITGTVKVGEVLTRAAGGWTPAPDSRTYQWRRCNAAGGSCADIAGETGTTYTLVAADLGQTIRVVETASKTAYNNATSTSAQTAVVANGDLTNTSPVSITGTVKVGEVLTRSAGGWTPSPDSRAYQWRRCDSAGANCADLGGETGTSYTLVAADLGQTIRVVETASKTAYNNATSTSTQTTVVANGDLTNTSPVSITGTVKVGEVLTRAAGGWTPAPDSRTYQWRRCNAAGGSCADISGETGTSYTLVAADLGQTIRVIETASKTAYNNATSTSSQTAVVAAGDLTNTSPVSITGTIKVGEVLTRSAGGWTPAPDSRAYQWRRCDNAGANCADLGGETGTSYTLVAADLGQTIRVVETASKTAYNNASSTSAQTTVVAAGDFTNTSPVGITGTVKVGEVLTRSAGGWTPAPDSRGYQWRRCDSGGGSCADIGGATGTTYTLVAADLGQTIRVVETASKTAYNNASSTSAQTAVVALGDLTNTAPVSITGTAKVGESLSRSSASWSPGPDSRAYQWRRCDNAGANCADIAGATGTDYTLVAADLGQTIRVVETASKTAYNNATSTSVQTAIVALGDFTNTTPVSVTGTAKVGELLTRSAASWTPGPDARTYQWRRCDNAGANCADIGGETGNTYVLAAADLGQTIRVVETASKTAYNNATSTSTQTGVVATGDFTNSSPVSITGTVKVGETLARSAASWTPGPDSRAYQWRRCDNAGANCSDLAGETGTSYTLVAADLGQTIRVVETASKTAYATSTSTSAQTVVVAPGDLTNTSPVSITGTPTVGASLTRSAAGWSPGPDSRAYQWRRCDAAGGNCADIAGATGTSYVLVGADFGQTIRVVETASKTAYNDAISTSVQTAVIAPGTITNTGVPTVSGTPTATLTLTATGGSWTPAGTSSAFQWVRCDADGTGCADLSGATGSTYVLVAGDVGKKLKVRETASKTGYTDASADSALTAEIADADLTPPTNTITLGSAAGAYLAGTTLYYRPAAAGSFTLSSAVADGGWGPAFASYPSVGQAGWTHGSESVTTPAGGPFVSSTFSWTGAATGTFPYVVTAGDLWSPPNTSQTTLSVTEDSTPPATSIECDAATCSAGWYTSSPVSVTLSATDGGAGADLTRYTTNGTDPTLFNGTTYTGAFSISAEGTTTVKFRSFDRVGNTENVQTQVVRLDTVAPDTSIDTGPSGSTSATGAAFTFSSADAGATFECRLLPGGSWAACSSPHSYSSLADGTYTFEARAVDQAGNTDASPATRTWTVDTVPADTTITSAPPADTNATGASFSFLASDAGPTFECKLDAGSFGACGSPKTYASLAEGSHTFSVRAVDAAGNADPTPATHTWTVDTTAPDTTIPLTPADPSSNTTPTFGFGSSQSPATYECRLDGGGWASCPTPHTVTPALADGSHTLEARATDAAGNTDGSPASYTWLVDATAPTGALTAPADGSAAAGTIAVTANSADAGGSGVMHALFETSPAGAGTWTAIGAPDMTSPYSVSLDTTTLADGDHDLRVTTRDNAGNSTVSAARTVEVDNTAPSLTVSAPNPVNLATADPATLTATASDTGTGVVSVSFEQCNETSVACDTDTWTSLGVDTTAPYSASWPLPGDGMRLLRVRATDGAGRVRTELVLTTVDRTVPSGTLTVPAAAANLRGSAPVAATAADGAPGGVGSVDFQITGQGAPYTDPAFASDSTGPSYDGTLDTTAHADGLYDLRAFVSDVNGNSAASARVTVRLDNTAPTGSVTAPAAGANLRGTVALASDSADSGSGVATVQFQRSPAGAGSWTSQAATWNTTLLTDGLYDLRVVTTDNAGGSFTSPAITVRVDNTAPTGSVTAPAAGANLRGTVALASDSADSGSGVATVQFQRSPAGAGSWTSQAATWNTTLLTDGLYDLRVVTTDNAGGSFTSPAITVRVDNTAPTGSVTAPANGGEIGVPAVTLASDSADPAVSGSASGVDTIVFERRPAGGGAWTVTPPTWDTASGPHAVADGSYELRVTTTDLAGNSFTSSAITVLVDHTAPVTTATPSPASPSNAPVTVTFTADDGAGSGVAQTSYRVDGGSTLTGTSVVISAPGDHSNDGSHTVEFFSTDDVGNVESTKSVTVAIDTTAPGGSTGDPGSYLRGIALLSYSTPDTDISSVQFQFTPAGMSLWVAVGAADVTPPYEVSWDTTLVADGAYDLRAVVTDSASNVSNVLLPGLPKYVDNTAPAGAVTSPAAAAFLSGTVDVDATGNDGASPPASGVSAVRFELKPSGAGGFSSFGTETTPVAGTTYRRSLDTTAHADGPAELRVVVTDVAGNETTSATRAVTIDNTAPTVTLVDPGAAVSGTPTLTATAAADTVSVTFERRPAGGGSWTTIAVDATPGDGFSAAFATNPLPEVAYDLRARAVDGGGNPGTSGIRTTLVDNTLPTGSLTAPSPGDVVGGASVGLAATAADTGSGVASVEFTVKPQGSPTYVTISTDSSAPYATTWDATAVTDGPAELRLVITDVAGNQRLSAVVPVVVDSSGPSVTLNDPGAVLAGPASLTTTTGGGAARVVFGISPAGVSSWSQLAEDTTAPFGTTFDTTVFGDGLYDLRAIGYDTFGNPSAPSLRPGVRFDNTAPRLVSSSPQDGSVSTAANQIVLTANEPAAVTGAMLDGAPAPAPTVSGSTLTFATGSLSEGLHVLSGRLEDGTGTSAPFRVAVTIESTPAADRPPVELSASPTQTSVLTSAGSLATVSVPATAWPQTPTAEDFLVLRVDPSPALAAFAPSLAPGSQLIEVTAKWALAGTPVTQFAAPITITIANASGSPVVPALSQDGTTWRSLPLLFNGVLPAGQPDGFYRDSGGVHVVTRHLTYFALLRDDEPPTPVRHQAGVVADDGLTLRWIPGSDNSGELGHVHLYVNGESYGIFDPTQFETKLGPFTAQDTREFTFVQEDAAGNESSATIPLRGIPAIVGVGVERATSMLSARGFEVGQVQQELAPGKAAGTVLRYAGNALAVEGSAIDLVVAGGAPPQTTLAFQVASAKRIVLSRRVTVPAWVRVTRPARLTTTLQSAGGRKLQTWARSVKAGGSIVRLPLAPRVRTPGTYRLVWVARAGTMTVRRSSLLNLVGAGQARTTSKAKPFEVVVTGTRAPGTLPRLLQADHARVDTRVAHDTAFSLAAAPERNVQAILVDVDQFGVGFLRDLHTVFPTLRLVALSSDPATLARAARFGADITVPRSARVERLARALLLGR